MHLVRARDTARRWGAGLIAWGRSCPADRRQAAAVVGPAALVALVLVAWPLRMPGGGQAGAAAGARGANAALDLDAWWVDRGLRGGGMAAAYDVSDPFVDDMDAGYDDDGPPQLVGLSFRPNGVSRAFFRDGDGALRVLKTGDRVGDGELVAIGRGHAVVEADGTRRRLRLADADALPHPPPHADTELVEIERGSVRGTGG